MSERFRNLKNYLKPKNPSLAVIAQLESSSGKFRNHPVVNSGVQKGTRAVSSYGLMPRTLYDLAQKNPDFQKSQLGQQILETGGDPEAINKLTADTTNDDEAAAALWNSQQQKLSKVVPPELLDDASVYAHRRGVTGAIKQYQSGKPFDEDPYVQNYKKRRKPDYDETQDVDAAPVSYDDTDPTE